MLIIESLIVVAALGFAADEPAAEPFENPEKVELFAAEREVIQWTNAERKKHGLAPLVVDASLVKTARKHTYWMASVHTLQHAGGAWAENIAQGQTSAWHAVSSWMGSSGHRANILNRRHRRIGVAGYKSSHGDVFWCQQFLE